MKPDWIKALEAAAEKFWKEEYPNKSFEEKLTYWKNTLEKGMKEQEKLGLPPFSVFNKAWFESVKEQESGIDQIIAALFEKDWKNLDKNAFDAAIVTEISDEEE